MIANGQGAGTILDELSETSRNLREILDAFTSEGKLQKSMDNIAAASEDIRIITHDNQPRLANAVANFESASSRLDSLLATHYATLDSSMTSFGRAGGKIDVAVDRKTATVGGRELFVEATITVTGSGRPRGASGNPDGSR